ncbi:purine-nucleoside phosphorylase [Halomonas stenophila]|uniref:Purine nucleoside phosphorylase DeoD-type n=1 Tax=Halomonas stenophila TaxID=795312 RepID=A0A7W5EPS5_9GAMM|nr:purine-nucleoside phosphorylase [Halomonas stenophila]MBB3229214.1 purine-nucleoside phosphorylase [Halomonas stenophila]
MATPHIEAKRGDFADTVLMPGDPLRAQHIAETFLSDVRQVNSVRNMSGYTGTYQGREISVMGHGMGIPSVSIYAKELITDYDVKRLIRVGSCGAVRDDVAVRDVVIGMGASTDSGVNRTRFLGHDFAAIADFDLTRHAVDAAAAQGVPVKVGNLFSADLFYNPDTALIETLRRYGIVGVEMEAAGLFGVAAEFGARAMTICTVSDHIVNGDSLSSEARATTFDEMVTIALDGVLRDDAAGEAGA